MTGTRTLPDERKDLSMLSVYVHALYYTVGTVSHVAIGDITAVNPYEYLCNVIFGWVGTFVYCLLSRLQVKYNFWWSFSWFQLLFLFVRLRVVALAA